MWYNSSDIAMPPENKPISIDKCTLQKTWGNTSENKILVNYILIYNNSSISRLKTSKIM